MAESKINGFIVVYLNLGKNVDLTKDSQSVERYMTLVKDMNKIWTDRIEKEVGYNILYVPTVDESSRVEKMSFTSEVTT